MIAPADLTGHEPADELTYLGFALAHVAAYREMQRLARIERYQREAMRRATGSRFRGGVVSFS